MPLAPELRAAYEAANYMAFAEPPVVFRIGEHNARLDELMESASASTAAFITAYNPHGLPAHEETNGLAFGELIGATGRPEWTCVLGEGTDQFEEWPKEPSILVIGISRADAESLGRRFSQLAIVFIEWGKAPELVVLA